MKKPKKLGEKTRLAARIRKILSKHYEDLGVRVLEVNKYDFTVRVTSDSWANKSSFKRIQEVLDILYAEDDQFMRGSKAMILHTVTREEAKTYIPKKKFEVREGCTCRACVLY